MSMKLPALRRGAEPFFLPGGPVGAVCVHGFTASPEEMRWLGEDLHARGLTVCGPRLAGHGTHTEMLRRQRWQDWYESVLDGVALVRAHCEAVALIGLSMGGLLTLRAAAAGLVDAAVVLAAPLYVTHPLVPHARWLRYVYPFYPADVSDNLDARVRELQRALGREDYGRVAYDQRNPTAAVAQLYALMQEVRAHLPEVTVPLALIYSRADRTVPFDNLRQVAEGVRSADVVQRVLERSGHVLTQDVERETVYDWVWEFIAARLTRPAR